MSRTFADSARRLSGRTALALGWRPPEFWAATPAELAAILSAETAPAALSSDTLSALLERHPD